MRYGLIYYDDNRVKQWTEANDDSDYETYATVPGADEWIHMAIVR